MRAADPDKLARVLGLLGSDHDGEVIAAARAAERLRRQTGKSWTELLLDQGQLPLVRPPAEPSASARASAAKARPVAAAMGRPRKPVPTDRASEEAV